jgi:hypothetical protein
VVVEMLKVGRRRTVPKERDAAKEDDRDWDTGRRKDAEAREAERHEVGRENGWGADMHIIHCSVLVERRWRWWWSSATDEPNSLSLCPDF